MIDYKELIEHFNNCEDYSTDPEKIRSSKLNDEILNKYNIDFEVEAEAKTVNLFNQNIKLFKNKEDTIRYKSSYSNSDTIIIIKEEIVYKESESSSIFFENIFYSEKIKSLFLNSDRIYHDIVTKKLIFLSEKEGKLEIGYKLKLLDFVNNTKDIKVLYEKLELKLEEDEYESFFRDNFIRTASKIENIDQRFFLTLKKLNNIIENTNREFELYKSKFSFDDFQSELHKEKEKYLKNLQEQLNDFLSKINTLPIQFGVYILLLFRFKENIYGLWATIVLIFFWTGFSLYSTRIMKRMIVFIKNEFNYVLSKIPKELNIEQGKITKEEKVINDKIKDIKRMISAYQILIFIFSGIFIVFSILTLTNLEDLKTKEKKIIQKERPSFFSKTTKLEKKEKVIPLKRIVNADKLNVRKNPSMNAGIIGKLFNNDVVNIIKKEDEWLLIKKESDNQTIAIQGWCKSSFLNEIKK